MQLVKGWILFHTFPIRLDSNGDFVTILITTRPSYMYARFRDAIINQKNKKVIRRNGLGEEEIQERQEGKGLR